MKKPIILTTALTILITSAPAFAEGKPDFRDRAKHRHEQLKDDGFIKPLEEKQKEWDEIYNMTPEERKAHRAEKKEKRAHRKEKRQERRENYLENNDITDEQKEKFKERRAKAQEFKKEVKQKRKKARRDYMKSKRDSE